MLCNVVCRVPQKGKGEKRDHIQTVSTNIVSRCRVKEILHRLKWAAYMHTKECVINKESGWIWAVETAHIHKWNEWSNLFSSSCLMRSVLSTDYLLSTGDVTFKFDFFNSIFQNISTLWIPRTVGNETKTEMIICFVCVRVCSCVVQGMTVTIIV